MLFNVDKNVKSNMLQMYKQDAEDFQNKKNDDKMRRIQEERSYIEKLNKEHEQENNKRQMEKQKRINETMGDYYNAFNRKEQERLQKFSKNPNFSINNYGSNINNYQDPMNRMNNPNFTVNEQNSIERNLNQKLTTSPKANNMDSILDRNKFQNLSDHDYRIRSQKVEQQKLYKDFLDGQVI